MARELILGTAGHIDHGKTALVRALTGHDTDRLPEEKARGLTIDIGFAELPLGDAHVGIVDVPGHERFIKNMLAGATGIDMALLVIAADDSVMPQTREHYEILRLLDIRVGIIVITKCDLMDDEWIDIVEQDAKALVAGSALADAPLVRTSAQTGDGIEALKRTIAQACARVPDVRGDAPARLAVDRAFNARGQGTVVTGSVWSGRLRVGDELVWHPAGEAVRVRGLQTHHRPVDEVRRGQRAAVSLSGVHHAQLARGHEIAAPGYLRPSRLLTVELRVLADSPRAIHHRDRLRLHVGTAETTAMVALTAGLRVEPGEVVMAQLFCADPVTTVAGQPYVLRSLSPVATLGGGHVIQPAAPRIRRRDADAKARLGDLRSDNAPKRAAAAAWFFGFSAWTALDLARDARLTSDEAVKAIDALTAQGVLVELPVTTSRSVRLHADVLAEVGGRVVAALRDLHAGSPMLPGIARRHLVERFAYFDDDALINAVIDHLIKAGEIEGDENAIAAVGHEPKLTAAQRALHDRIVEAFHAAGFAPPDPMSLATGDAASRAAVRQLLDLCVAEGNLTHLGGALYLHHEHERRLRTRVAEALRSESQGMTVAQIRDVIGSTRKFTVPLCEYLDRIGLTRRAGDLRHLADAHAAKV